ncbi:MMPL family transporter [Bacillus sp. FJAT-49736]|uniref:MMPL family transporter n=1 Tax=Bacillus sp. FJAT-49736 TaxID=2833582 RepID=UPI0020162357|nr:MMPL family transporter [Bacillus sp. FJAT-49736]
MNKIAHFISSSKGSKIILLGWLAVIIILSVIAPSAKQYSISSGEGSVHENTPSAKATKVMDKYFPTKDGLTALLVFHDTGQITEQDRAKITEISKWLSSDSKPKNVSGALPFHQLPEQVQNKMLSDDKTTLILNVALKKGLDSDQIYDTIEKIKHYTNKYNTEGLKLEITGPAGISSDTISLFKNADLILMFATIGLILVILMIIYRSPLLAIIPLVIAGMIYQVVDRILGLAARYEWFTVDKQALSIMMILLFAVLTDYCLFILARYRVELKVNESKYEAMKKAFTHVMEPILFSGGTVLVAMFVLFFANFQPYHYFAPVFSVAMVVILLGGVTLIPALFAVVGRKAFWPFIPKYEKNEKRHHQGIWAKVGSFVTRKPGATVSVLLLFLILSALNVGSLKYSFNIMKSFPNDITSRQGYEILEKHFPQGELAPVTVILESHKEIVQDSTFAEKINDLEKALKTQEGVSDISPKAEPGTINRNANNFLSEDKHAVKLQLTLKDNPYDQSSLNVINKLRENGEAILQDSGFNTKQFSIYYSGQTAEQLDVKNLNNRDMIITFLLIAIFITIMLAFQARSVVMAFTMIGTMLLSYVATLGLGWMVFHYILGYDAISYRLPVYTFVFLVALGVDYNIMVVSRIREEARHFEWKEAVARGVSLTGGVISSAGIILAATFCVLMTQPLQELFLFGMTMGIGVLMDTFLVRGMLLPAILTFLKPKTLNRTN